jgi:SPP1 family phage portal protein
MAYLTQTDIANTRLRLAKQKHQQSVSDSEVLKHLIKKDEFSELKKEMRTGVKYFEAKHIEINRRKITYFLDSQEVEDKEASNAKLQHTFHRIIVEQKAGYIAGKPIKITSKEKDNKMAEEFKDKVIEILGEQFDDMLPQWIKGASNKGTEWLHVFINEEGEFDYVIIPAEQIIPVYDSRYQKKLMSIIRYYEFEFINSKGESEFKKKVEWYDEEKVTFYIEEKRGGSYGDNYYVLDIQEAMNGGNPRPHWVEYNTEDPENIISGSWGSVPFIELPNNDERINDLRPIKNLIDDYDLHNSDMSNKLADLQDAIWVLENYEGDSLREFRKNLKTYKALKVGEDGGAEPKVLDLPEKASKAHLDREEDNIFINGMAVNLKTDKFGNAPSGVALKFIYSLLDLKANVIIRKLNLALSDLFYFISVYLKDVAKDGGEYDYKLLAVTFDKSAITNEAEKIKSLNESRGILSMETIVSEHPYAKENEIDLMEAEQEEMKINDPYLNEPDGEDEDEGEGQEKNK